MHHVYRLPDQDYHRYRGHLLSLDDESKYRRFGYQIPTDMINQLCNGIQAKPKSHKLFVVENDELEIVGVGHIAFQGDEMELAFSVLKEYQGKGIGSSLMSRCIEWCQNRNIKQGSMVCLSTNTAIKRLASKHGVLVNDHGETLATIKIPDATAISVMHEVAESNFAKFDHLGKIQRKIARTLTLPLLFK